MFLLGNRVDFVRNPISYIYNETYYELFKSGRDFGKYFELFSNISEMRNENESLKAQNSKYKSELESIYSLIEENTEFKKMNKFSEKSDRYQAVRMFQTNTLEEGLIDSGKKEGIKQGDVVQFSQYYVGMVDKVSEKGALVKLPYSRSSFLKVSIIKPVVIEGVLERVLAREVVNKVKSKGVLIGKGDSVVVENITTDKGVVDGDFIIITDEKVGKYLIVGTVKDLNNDPASSSITAQVEISVNYDDLNTYFISVNE